MNAQEAQDFCLYLADNDYMGCSGGYYEDGLTLKAVALFIKQQQNTIVNLRLADKEEISALKAEIARLKKVAKGINEDYQDIGSKLNSAMTENARLKEKLKNFQKK